MSVLLLFSISECKTYVFEESRREMRMRLYLRNKTRESIVVFIDILGFKDQIVRAYVAGNSELLLKKLRGAIKEAKTAFHSWWPPPLNCPTCEAKLFTDNIVIGFPIPHGKTIEEVMRSAIIKCAAYQCALANEGFFIRGGIAVGEHYMDNDIVFGAALLEAYLLESNKADVPRIVFGEEAAKYVDPNDPSISLDHGLEVMYINNLD